MLMNDLLLFEQVGESGSLLLQEDEIKCLKRLENNILHRNITAAND
jgi:hypothetical protein